MTISPTKTAQASLEHLYRIFTAAEEPGSTLALVDDAISENLMGFLHENIVASNRNLSDLESDFNDPHIPEEPMFVSEHAEFLLDKLVAESVHTASPAFVGHMTSAFPYFMLPLSKIMIALNQNVVKTETSKAFTPLERQVIAMLHHLVYGRDEYFYQDRMHNAGESLGALCSGGTIANLTALWLARNNAFPATADSPGIRETGWIECLERTGYRSAALVVSERGHYSLTKAADVLGIGRNRIIPVSTDSSNRIDLSELEKVLARLKRDKVRVISLIGIAGTTETGHVDPLEGMANIAESHACHFHVDAAWGGPTLFSDTYRHLLKGIERADSVTIDAHKQLYVPMGAGLVLFKTPEQTSEIVQHANYIIREGSKDLGSTTLEGSRAGMSMLVYSGLRIIGRQGYQLLIDQGINKAREFSKLLNEHDSFELITEPELNILTYRFLPVRARDFLENANESQRNQVNELLNELNRVLQKVQRERGISFVSRTRLKTSHYPSQEIDVLRVVLANPLTTINVLAELLAEQAEIVLSAKLDSRLTQYLYSQL
jgi:glutamate decarboxylase